MSGMFFNLSETTFPAGNAETFSSPIAMLEKLAEGVRVQKEHCITAYARPVEGAPCPAYEMRITYPGGFTGDGNQHASGYQVHRSFLIGDTVYQVFVDVLDAVKEPKPGMIDARIEHLFSSVRIDDTARGPGIAGSDSSVPADLK